MLALQPGAGDAVQALKAGVMEIADIFCINKADHPQAKGRPTRFAPYWTSGRSSIPSPGTPPIIMTRGDTGEGVEELEATIEKHRSYLEESGKLEERRRASLKEFVISWAKERLEEEMQERLSREDDELMEKVYGRELDPISASERIFREV